MGTKIWRKNKPTCFVIDSQSRNKGNRLDCKYYDPKYIRLNKMLSKIPQMAYLNDDLIDVTDGEHGKRMYIDDGILFLRISNIKEEGFDLNNVKYISIFDHYGRLKRARLLSQNVVMTTTGTVGVSQVIPNDFPEANISADVVKITIKDRSRLLPQYLSLFLNSELGRLQTEWLSTGGSRDRIIQKNVHKIRIRMLNPDSQEKIVQTTSTMLKRANKQLKKYDRIIHSISKLLSKEYKIKLPTSPSMTFTVENKKLENRFDCNFNSPDFEKLRSILREAEKKKVFKIILGKDLNIPNVRIRKKEYEKIKLTTLRYIDIGSTSKDLGDILETEENILLNLPTRARQKIKTNDVLLPRPIGSTEGVVIVPKEFDAQICSTGFIVIRPKNEEEALLLWTILRSELVQKQFYYLQSGSIQPEITPRNFKKHVLIPFPKEDTLHKIVEETRQIIAEARQSWQKYKESQKSAKTAFLKLVKNYKEDKARQCITRTQHVSPREN